MSALWDFISNSVLFQLLYFFYSLQGGCGSTWQSCDLRALSGVLHFTHSDVQQNKHTAAPKGNKGDVADNFYHEQMQVYLAKTYSYFHCWSSVGKYYLPLYHSVFGHCSQIDSPHPQSLQGGQAATWQPNKFYLCRHYNKKENLWHGCCSSLDSTLTSGEACSCSFCASLQLHRVKKNQTHDFCWFLIIIIELSHSGSMFRI